VYIGLHKTPTESGGLSLVIWDHTNVTYHLTQVNILCLNPSQRPVLDLSIPDSGKAQLT